MKPYIGMVIYSNFTEMNGAKIVATKTCKFCKKQLFVMLKTDGTRVLVEYDKDTCAILRHRCEKKFQIKK
jgi:O-glycosyl hydrolase